LKLVRFTVRPEAHKLYGCRRCRARLLRGEHAVSEVRPGSVTYRHAGRWCPPIFNRKAIP
jgi:hypothetical protein